MNRVYIFIMIGLIFLAFFGIYYTPVFGDESEYHYPMVRNITIESIVNPDSNYSSAYPPLPYTILKLFYKVCPSIYMLRVVNFIIYICMLVAFYKLTAMYMKNNIPVMFLLSLNPYAFKSAYILYMFNWGLLFSGISLYFWFNKQKIINRYLSIFFMTCAVYSSQWMLAVPISLIGFQIINNISGESLFNQIRNLNYRDILVLLIPYILFFPLYYYWGGLVHSNVTMHRINPNISSFQKIFIVIGYFYFMYLTLINRKISLAIIFFIIVLIPLMYLFIPEPASDFGIGYMSGIPSRVAAVLEQYTFISSSISLSILSIIGLLLIISSIKYIKIANNLEKVCFIIFIMMGISFIMSEKLGTSHVMISLQFLSIAIISMYKRSIKYGRVVMKILITWWVVNVFVYNIYIIFIRSAQG